MKKTTTPTNSEHCEACGYPFDRHETAWTYDADGEGPAYFCSKACAETWWKAEMSRRNGGQNFACFL